MTDAAPPGQPPAPGPGSAARPETRPARKRFILVGFGIGILVVVLVGLLTGIGSGHGSPGSGSGGQPQAGDPVPSFSAANIGPVGPRQLHVPSGGVSNGTPAVLLFFGAWCSACRSELPPLASAVTRQDQTHGPLSQIRVIGVDTLDSSSTGKDFIRSEGVGFPVASDADASITQGTFHFRGDPYTVFVKADGTISKVVIGAQLSPATFTADERALIPSGR